MKPRKIAASLLVIFLSHFRPSSLRIAVRSTIPWCVRLHWLLKPKPSGTHHTVMLPSFATMTSSVHFKFLRGLSSQFQIFLRTSSVDLKLTRGNKGGSNSPGTGPPLPSTSQRFCLHRNPRLTFCIQISFRYLFSSLLLSQPDRNFWEKPRSCRRALSPPWTLPIRSQFRVSSSAIHHGSSSSRFRQGQEA